MKRLLVAILMLLCSGHLIAYDNDSISFSLNDSIYRALKRNPQLKLIDLKIKKTKLDIDQKYSDVKDTDLKRKRLEYDLLMLENQKMDIIDTVHYDVEDKYYSCLVAKERNKIADEDFKYTKSYYQESLKNYKEGKIDQITFEQVREQYKQKEEEVFLSRSEYRRAVLAFLLAVDESLGMTVRFKDSLRENHKLIRFKTARKNFIYTNRNILLKRLNYEVRVLEEDLIDEEIMSKNEIRRARFNLNEANTELEYEIRKQKVELVTLYLLVKEGEAQLTVAEQRLYRSKKAYDVAETRYRQGYIAKNVRDNLLIAHKQQYFNYLQTIKMFNLAKIRFFFLLN